VQLFRDLLDAFSQDVTTKRYADYAAVLDYCRRSANPIGRLLLHLFRMTDAQSLEESDAVCSSLQLINFWQDVAIDWQKGRVYIPVEDLDRFHVTEDDIAHARVSERWSQLMAFECNRSRSLIESGAPLGRRRPGRMGLEIRATVQGGLRNLDRIDAAQGDVFRKRPVLKAWDWMLIVAKSI
jgi:squalene synthase HpnC